ncbi:protein PFC0760c-like [Helicoverpa zea]|uniref:protein PFC0760c-like n=1 Tax=Helicoverpa zea TaxID=7113 RepID=UPI001F5642D3|nr:protein PFC0760c-like [Helicoverpa zea]
MEVMYKHCSALIYFTEFNLKMHRGTSSYQEEWQRRVSRRVDSLFVDLPVLSPVTEEASDLTDKSLIPHDDESDSSTRSVSPLPPLIIEILPNKHDEPEEYYVKLQKRMIKVYRRLFIENRSLSSGVYDSDSNGNSDLDSFDYDEIGFDGNVRDVENRTLSNGIYGSISNGNSDHEGFDCEGKDLDGNVRDFENRSLSRGIYDSNSNGSSNDDGMDYEAINFDGNVRGVENRTLSNGVYSSNTNGSSDHDGMDYEARDFDGNVRNTENRNLSHGIYDLNYNVTIPVADYGGNNFNNGTDSNDSHYSDDYEADFESIDTTIESLNRRGIDAEMSRPDYEDRQSLAPTEIIDTEDLSNPNLVEIERPISVQNVIFPKDLHNARIDDDDNEMLHESSSNDLNESHQRNDFEESRNSLNTDLVNNDNEIEEDMEAQDDDNDLNESHQRNDFEDINADESRNTTNTDLVNDDNEIALNQEDIEAEDCDDNDLNVVEVVTDENEETTLSAGTDYRQITTIALVHVDGTKHHKDKESTVYEESVKSVILPTRPVVRTAIRSEVMQVDFEDVVRVEDNEDPPTILPDLSYQESSIKEIEQMRFGNPDLSQESISLTHYRDSESLEPIAYIETPTENTSSSQNGAGGHFEFDISNDIHEILSYNFNESRKSSSNSRKRKADLDSKSVQTSEVSTRDYFDGQIFLKGAKVFRLCSCKDHVCH